MNVDDLKRIISRKEIESLFDNQFLPQIYKMAKLVKRKCPDEDIKFFYITLGMKINNVDGPFTLASLEAENNICFSFNPVTQEELDKRKKENETKDKDKD